MALTEAVIEWRDARQAFFDCRPPKGESTPREVLNRLSRAEQNLMTLARGINGPEEKSAVTSGKSII